MSTRESNREALLWKALGDATRRGILDLLRPGPLSTGAICAGFPTLDRCTVMKHLELLVEAGLVLVRRRGRLRENHLNAAPIAEIVGRWAGRFQAAWIESAERLRGLVTEGRAKPVDGDPGNA